MGIPAGPSQILMHAGAVTNEAEQIREELQQIEDDRVPHSDDFPVFQLVPKDMLTGKGKSLKLLPNDMGQWHKKVTTHALAYCTAVPK